MKPLAQPNRYEHPKLESMATFKDGDEIIYRCTVYKAFVSSRDLDQGELLV
jgi:hypothetical protein